MNFTKLLKSLFGDKSSRDMKLIQPLVEQAKAKTPLVEALDNDALRARVQEIKANIQAAANEQKAKIAELKATIEETPIDERAAIFAQIDKLDKEALELYEVALNEAMPEVYAIVKDAGRSRIHGTPIGLRSVAHRSRSVIHRSRHHADIRKSDIIKRHIVLDIRPFHLFHTEHAFKINDMRIPLCAATMHTLRISTHSMFLKPELTVSQCPMSFYSILAITSHRQWLH